MEKNDLKRMVSAHTYDAIVEKVKKQVGEKAFGYIFPAVKKALEEGNGEVREEILIGWLDLDCCRVCSNCGAIMEEGWYLDWQGYACSDDCCCKLMEISKEEYDRYSIYLEDIKEYLKNEGLGRKPEELTEKEIHAINEEIIKDLDSYYYTEWY